MPSDDIRYHLDSLSFSLDLDARQIVVSVALLTTRRESHTHCLRVEVVSTGLNERRTW
jgi:hypothetical protein